MSTYDPDFGPGLENPDYSGPSMHGDSGANLFSVLCFIAAAIFLAMAVWGTDTESNTPDQVASISIESE